MWRETRSQDGEIVLKRHDGRYATPGDVQEEIRKNLFPDNGTIRDGFAVIKAVDEAYKNIVIPM